ncbi:monoamine oxidase, partial [Klebsiella pneumoniae]|nr:monoamine oxidase [Klebsiella pneumoniae]
SAIKKVELQGEKVLVENEKGDQGTFDRVIVATPTSKLEEFLNPEQFAEDMNLLKQFRFEQGDLVIHTDATVMPPRRKDRLELSYMMDRKFTRLQFTVWKNAGEPAREGRNPVFQAGRGRE